MKTSKNAAGKDVVICPGDMMLIEDVGMGDIYCSCPAGTYIDPWTNYSAPKCVAKEGCPTHGIDTENYHNYNIIVDVIIKFCALVPNKYDLPVDNYVASEYDPFAIFEAPAVATPNKFTKMNVGTNPLTVSSSLPNTLVTTIKMHSSINTEANGIICNTTTSCLTVITNEV